ncbi:UNVERIFIED_CONTAM: Chaperonin-like RBCX protein 1, chloroplastic [Sesamum latifolium]|uniref:Chaperonin-like RBCX protein 1, chloroplastic n=1 Tax=Sesamum latifolium TaxID=2727402 RepID=A0AAW2WN90_9LAMI
MESSAFVQASQFSLFLPKRHSTNRATLPFKPWKPTTSRSTTLQCHKMYVPGQYKPSCYVPLHHLLSFLRYCLYLNSILNFYVITTIMSLEECAEFAGFGEASPEAKAAKHLHDFFTYVAVRIVSAQLQKLKQFVHISLLITCICRPVWMRFTDSSFTEQSYNPEAYADMMQFLERHSLDDGDKFCADLMRESSRHKSLALRILEVRSAYCKSDFEWDNLKRLSLKMVDDRNTRVMRDYVSETSSVKSESEK